MYKDKGFACKGVNPPYKISKNRRGCRPPFLKPLGNYIVDFYCKPLKLVIEVDGGYHFTPEQRVRDQRRQQILEGMNLHFLRFRDEEVRKDMNTVIKAIESYIEAFEATCQ